MTGTPQTFLDILAERADAAQREENDLRAEAAKLIARLERERVFAFRRAHLMREMWRAARDAETNEDAPAAAAMAVCAELGWERMTQARQMIIGRLTDLADVAAASAREPQSEEGAPAAAARAAEALDRLAAFESWYEREFGQPFLALLDSYMPETPVVDF